MSGQKSYETKSTFVTVTPARASSSYQAIFGGRARSSLTRNPVRHSTISAVSVSESFSEIPGILNRRTEEKHELSSLNDRFATYIDKVRRLEAQNNSLLSRIAELESTRNIVSRSGDIYEGELNRLRKEIERLTHENAEVEIQLHSAVQEIESLKKSLQIEVDSKKEAEDKIASLRKDVDDATLVRVDLERRLENALEEIALLRKTTDEDIETLRTQLSVKREEVFDAPVASTDLTESLRDIRVAYETLSTNSSLDLEKVYKANIAELQVQLRNANAALLDAKGNLADTRRQLQGVTVEIESLRSTNSSLENQIADLEERNDREGRAYNERITALEAELQKSRDEMTRYLADYNKLLNLKLSLDLEISTYRKLLEGEEGRIRKTTGANSSVVETATVVHSSRGPQILLKEEVKTIDRSSNDSSSTDSESD